MGLTERAPRVAIAINASRLRWLAGVGILSVGLGVATIGGAFAAPSAAATPTATPAASSIARPFGGPPGGMRMGGGFIAPVASYLGVSTTDLRTALDNGQTLAQIAQAHGKSAADLKSFLLNQDSGRIDQLINTNFKQLWAQRPAGFGGPPFADVANFLGMSATDLQTALKNGQTLAQVAQSHGKSASDLKAFLQNQLKSRLDQEVSAGRLTSQQETDRLNQASSHIDQLINSTGPQGGPPPFAPPPV